MITHIDSCRNGAGYCILGYSCEVDKDFTKDDLGGHCRGLSKAFNPRASFVCCRENPKTSEASKVPTTLQHIIDAGYSENQSNIKTRLENKKYKNIGYIPSVYTIIFQTYIKLKENIIFEIARRNKLPHHLAQSVLL